jgi:hypothetical protein
VAKLWSLAGLPTLAVIQFASAFGRPLTQQSEKQVQQYMLLRQLIGKMESLLGETGFSLSTLDLNDIFRGATWNDLEYAQKAADSQISFYTAVFDELRNYSPPVEHKYSAFLNLQAMLKSGNPDESKIQRLIQEVKSAGLSDLLQEFLNRHIPLLSSNGDLEYCPRCSGKLTGQVSSELKRGKIVQCSVSHDALIYHVPERPSKWIW